METLPGEHEKATERAAMKPFGIPLIGVSPAMGTVKCLIRRATDTERRTLIFGEPGVGKEAVVQNIYHLSRRAGRPFVKKNFSLLPEKRFVAPHRIHTKDDSAGDAKQYWSKTIDLCRNGVLFLDKIAQMPRPSQDRFAEFLRNSKKRSAKSGENKINDVWLITSNDRNPDQEVREGNLSAELYGLLAEIQIHIPPLRKRPDDIMPLIEYFLEQYTGCIDTAKRSKPGPLVEQKLTSYHWPGNVRDIQMLVRCVLAESDWEQCLKNLAGGPKPGPD